MDRNFLKHITMACIACMLWLISIPTLSQPIDQQTALQMARQFMATKGRSITQQKRAAMVTSGMNAYCYVFNADQQKGYVVVSGDERTPAILGYSEEGMYDETLAPQNLRSWLQHYADEIAIIQRQHITGPKRAVANCGPAIDMQTTSTWDQTSPYNTQCPMVTSYSDEDCTQRIRDAQQAVTGCAATALAQVLYTWKDELQATGASVTQEIPARTGHKWRDPNVSQNGQRINAWLQFNEEAIPAGTTIDWGNLVDDCHQEGVTEEQKAAVAQLMHICGAAMNMNYGVAYGSGSSASDAGGGMAAYNYLGFEHVRFHVQPLYAYQEWLQMLYDEVKVAKAVYFGGQSSSSGHGFVIDGYDHEDLFHVNWGWSGNGNGYYRINSLLPIHQGTGGAIVNDGFRMEQIFVTGLYPHATAPSDQPAMNVLMFYSSDGETEVVDKCCTLSLGYSIQNVSCPLIKNCQVGFCLESSHDKQYYMLSDFKDMRMYSYFDTDMDGEDYVLTLTGLEDGDYQLYPCFRTADKEEAWEPCAGYENHAVLLNVHGGNASVTYKEEYVLSVKNSDEKAEYTNDEDVKITYRMKVEKGSLHDVIYTYAVPLDNDGNQDDTRQISVSAIKEMYYGEKGTEFDLPCSFGTMETGNYLILAQNEISMIETELGSVKVVAGTDGIQKVTASQPTDKLNRTYNLQGRPVSSAYKGIVIHQQGNETKKIFTK